LLYGAVELIFATQVIWFIISSTGSPEIKFGAYLGAIFVAVRGLDNIQSGLVQWVEKQEQEREKTQEFLRERLRG
jgi:hypothetical protein